MAGLDLTALLALDEAQKLIAGSDPYLTAKQAPDAIGQLVLGASKNPDYSTGELVASALMSGLLSGGLQGVSNDYQSRALEAYQDVIDPVGLLTGTSTGVGKKPSVLSADVFDLAKNRRNVFALDVLERRRNLQDAVTLDEQKNLNDIIGRAISSEDPAVQDWGFAQMEAKGLPGRGASGVSEADPEVQELKRQGFSFKEAQKEVMRRRRAETSSGMGIALTSKIAEATAITDEFNFVADKLKSLDYNWGDLRAARNLSAADQEQLGVVLANLADRFEKLRTGAASSARENYGKLVAGDPSGDAKLLYKQLKELARAEARNTLSVMDSAHKLATGRRGEIIDRLQKIAQGDSGSETLATVPTVGSTFNGEKVLAVKKIK